MEYKNRKKIKRYFVYTSIILNYFLLFLKWSILQADLKFELYFFFCNSTGWLKYTWIIFEVYLKQAHSLQLDIRKKIFRIIRIFEKYSMPRANTLIYSIKHLFMKIRSLKRKFMIKNFFKNLLCSNCDLWCLQKRHSWKQQNLSYLSHKEKSTSMMLLKTRFYVR